MLVNKQFEDVHGIDSKDVIGKTSFDLFPKEIAENFFSQDEKVLQSGAALQEEMETVFKDGKPAIILTTKFPIIGPDGQVEGVGGINLDRHGSVNLGCHQSSMYRLSRTRLPTCPR